MSSALSSATVKVPPTNWGFYEREFRLLVSRGEAKWGRSHLELLLHAVLLESGGEGNVGSPQQAARGPACPVV